MILHTIKTFMLLSTIALLISCGQNDSEESQYIERPRIVKTEIIKLFDGTIERHITGRLQAAENTTLSFEVNGVIKKVNMSLGESFTKGQLLAELDNKIYTLTAEQSLGLLGEASAAKFEARQALDRNLSLKKQKLVSQAVVDSAQATYNIADERVKSAQSALDIANKNLSDTKLYAPYDGTVSARLIEPSQQITTQTPIFTIQGKANLEVNAVVPESIIGRLALGKQVSVHIPALSDTYHYKAILTEIGTQASVANAFPITITFDEAYSQLLPGMSAEIMLPLKDSNINSEVSTSQQLYKIPLNAFATDAEGQYIQIVEKQNKGYFVRKHYIKIEQTISNAVLTSLSDLPATAKINDKVEVVTAGLTFIKDKQNVMPLNKTQQIYNQ
jgi:RND family efflux transporter MFP subunit